MKKIFIGFLLVFLDFTINFGNSHIGLIPDFVGYMVMIKGLDEMARESHLFMRIKPYAKGMVVYTSILYFMHCFGISATLNALVLYIPAILSTIISLYISYNIVMGVKEMEDKYNTLLNGDSLKSTWTLLVVFNVLSFVSLLIFVLAVVIAILCFIAAICFIVAFNKSKNLYYEMNDPLG